MSGEDYDYGEKIKSLPVDEKGNSDFSADHGCCRDLYCLILFAVGVVALVVIFIVGFTQGKPKYLIYPIADGVYCGLDFKGVDNRDKPYLKILNFPDFDNGECVSECPSETIEILWRCIPYNSSYLEDVRVFGQFKDALTVTLNDLQQGWWIFFVAFGITVVLTFAFFCCFQICVGCVVWTIIVITILIILAVGIWILIYGIKHNSDPLKTDKTSSYVFIGFGIGIIVVSLLLICIFVFLRKHIGLACALIGESSKAIRNMCCLLPVPVVYIVLFIVATVLFIFTFVYYCSSLKIDINTITNSRDIIIDNKARWIILFTFLMFLWVTAFIIGMNQTTIAGAGASWYFTHDKSDIPLFPVAKSAVIMIFHHLGSIAVGSFLIAIVLLIRTIVLYLEKKMKKAGLENKCVKYACCCLQCCLSCLTRLIGFISSRAYIMMSIHGKSFFPSAFDALNLMLRNPLRSTVLVTITKFIIICSELLVTIITTVICIIIMRPSFIGISTVTIHVYNWWLLAFFCALFSFVSCYLAFEVYDFLVDTIFLCFLQDEEMAHTNSTRYKVYASPDLQEYMNIATDSGSKSSQYVNYKYDGADGGAKRQTPSNTSKIAV